MSHKSPCDSFDWRNEISPVVVKPRKHKAKRRSSFVYHKQAASPFKSPPMVVAKGVVEPLPSLPALQQARSSQAEEYNWRTSQRSAFHVPSTSPGLHPRAGHLMWEGEPHFEDSAVVGPPRSTWLEPINESTPCPFFVNATKGPRDRGLADEKNRQLRKRLEYKSDNYESSIAPFRSIFETVSALAASIGRTLGRCTI